MKEVIQRVNAVVNDKIIAQLMGYRSIAPELKSEFNGDSWKFVTAYSMPNVLARYEFERNQYREKSRQVIYIQATVYPEEGEIQQFILVKFDTKRHRIEIFDSPRQRKLASQRLVVNAIEKQLSQVARGINIIKVNIPCEDNVNYSNDIPYEIAERSTQARRTADRDGEQVEEEPEDLFNESINVAWNREPQNHFVNVDVAYQELADMDSPNA